MSARSAGETTLVLPHGQSLHLNRYPQYPREQLRAWDAADEYLLNYLVDQADRDTPESILIINDSFGTLTLGARHLYPQASITSLSDSYTARHGLQQNAALNQIDCDDFALEDSLSLQHTGLKQVDLVLIKVPKSLAQLQLQLACIRHLLSPRTQILGGAMTKQIHNSTLDIFARELGTTTTSLARKKARLIFSQAVFNQPDLANHQSTPEPEHFQLPGQLMGSDKDVPMFSYAGTFAHGKLDQGSRFLLENLRISPEQQDILDLGCGYGVLGIAAGLRQRDASLTFVDEHALSVASARLSAQAILSPEQFGRSAFIQTHCLDGIAEQSQDLILNNPPFHDASARTPNIALNMFSESHRVLKPGGLLVVVANRHLGYHLQLKRRFGDCQTLIGNKKFVILQARKEP